MGTAGFTHVPLRGYVPYGELDVNYDLMRTAMTVQIPMWEGCDRPFLRSINLVGDGGSWIRPDETNPSYAPAWNLGPVIGDAGAPHSGHIGQAVYADASESTTGRGWKWNGIIDPVISQFVVGRNYAFLIVGTAMTKMDPDLSAELRGDAFRNLLRYSSPLYATLQNIRLNYETEQIRWFHLAQFSTASPIIPFYGKRVAMLFVNGDEAGEIPPPRVFIADESGNCERANFSTSGAYSMWDSRDLELFALTGVKKAKNCAGGMWEYYAHFIRSFEDEEARAICRDAVGAVKWDPYVARRIGWRHRVGQVIAQASVYGRVSANPAGWPRVIAAPTNYPRVSATARGTGPRVTAAPTNYARISARIRIADKEADVQATPLCPSEMNWMADNVLELADVQDDMQTPPADITSANSVTVEIWDRDTDQELGVSPVTINQVGSTNAWRDTVLVNEANGFAQLQRLVLIFIFDGGTGLQGRFYALAVVAAATS